jgi:hypothetical protein
MEIDTNQFVISRLAVVADGTLLFKHGLLSGVRQMALDDRHLRDRHGRQEQNGTD